MAQPARDYASTRYSPLGDITAANVAQLKPAWSFSTGVPAGHEAPPLVVGSTMYIVTPFPNTVYALDLAQPGAPVKWKYDPKPEAAAKGVACCDTVNRGAMYDGGRIFFNTLDAHTIALDAETGKELWTTKVGDINIGETVTMAPLVVKGKVLVGNSGGEVRRARLAHGARRGERRRRLARLRHRPRPRRAHRPRLQAVLRDGPRPGPMRIGHAQGLYYVATALWPVLHLDSFERVSGAKGRQVAGEDDGGADRRGRRRAARPAASARCTSPMRPSRP